VKNAAVCGEVLLDSTTQNGKNVEVETIRREVIEQELNLAWLGGLIEGEGCFTASLIPDKLRGINGVRPRLVISNSVLPLLEKVKEILESFGVRCHVVFHKRKDRKYFVGNLSITGNNNLLRIVPKLLPYLYSKKEQAELVISIINRKIELSQSTERIKGQSIANDPLILMWIEKLHALKQDGKFSDNPSTTIRCTPQRLGMLLDKCDPETLSQIAKVLEEDDIVSSATETCS
jgi:hypothetical protein